MLHVLNILDQEIRKLLLKKTIIYSISQFDCLLQILNIKGPKSRKSLLKEIIKLKYTPVILVALYTEHTRSINMEATLNGNS